MKKTLFIGAIVLDMIIRIDHLPKLKEDIHAENMSLSVGGCSYNACKIVQYFRLPAICCSPIGKGIFASQLMTLLQQSEIQPMVHLEDEDNGCCICLVNRDGERTFLCKHGVEYRFDRNWLKDIQRDDLDYIYVNGLELEEKDGDEILSYLEEMKLPVFFAPGARVMHIQQNRMQRMLALHPIFHLNEDEIATFMRCETVSKAAQMLHEKTKQLVIVTCGERGAYYVDECGCGLINGIKAKVQDTIGAGDAHAGACLVGLKMNMEIHDILLMANKIASKVVSVEGAMLRKKDFDEIILK